MATPTNLPASFTTGAVLTAAQMNDLRGAFRIMQVKSFPYSTPTSNTTTTFAATGLTLAITPQSTSSQILVLVNVAGAGRTAGNGSIQLELRRGTTQLATHNGSYTNTSGTLFIGSMVFIHLDSPNTTASTTYDVRFRGDAAGMTTNVQDASSYSSITLFEVSA